MSIFNKIKDAIFGREAHAAPASPSAAEPTPAPSSTPEPAATTAPPVGGTKEGTPTTAGASNPSASQPVDVASQLDAAVKKTGHKLDWKHSIVDLMKALGMDASLAERKQLAEELGYSGKPDGSAEMNIWLHKALMKKLSENGGKVPADLLD